MSAESSVWGDRETKFFYELTPERILDAVEKSTRLRCTGRILALNSMENRVYEIEIELNDKPKNPSDRFLIAKFYRPGRWNAEQILEEHRFLADLANDEIPAVAPIKFHDGKTLHTLADVQIFYAVFPKIGGRSPDELDDDQLGRVGRLLARIHNVGATRPASHRLALTPATYGRANLAHLLGTELIPPEMRDHYRSVVEPLCDLIDPWFAASNQQRVHGDCHMGNLLWGRDGLFFVDFDDMVRGPCVQDLWLLIPGRDEYARRQLMTMIEAYETMRPFDYGSLRLIEALRALRFIHFSAWIGRRWQDPAFPRAFPQYGTQRYWQEQIQDLREQFALLSES